MIAYEALRAWDAAERAMPRAHALAIGRSGGVRVEPTTTEDVWVLRTDSRVGVIVGDGWQITIRPRLAIPKLLFLLAYSLRPEGWRDLHAQLGAERDLFEAVAAGFAFHALEALRPGVLHGYVPVEAREPGVRGRVRFGDQLARLPGLALPVELAYDEFSADVPENRLLRAACELLLRFPRIPPQARRRLRWIRAALDEVTVPADARRLAVPPTTRLNARYANALALAQLIVRRSSLAAEHGSVTSTSFLFDMNEVFESFLFAALRDALRRRGGTVERQRPAILAPGLTMRTDVTWHVRGRVRAVADAKYKSLVDQATMPNADAYQMLAYCIALGLPRGHLVYAKESGRASGRYRVVRHGYEILVHAVDVELAPEELLRQVREVADAIAVESVSGTMGEARSRA